MTPRRDAAAEAIRVSPARGPGPVVRWMALVLLLGIPGAASGQGEAEAERAHRDGDFARAASLYAAAAANRPGRRAALHFNAAQCEAAAGLDARAVWHLECALASRPDWDRARNTLADARKRLGIREEEPGAMAAVDAALNRIPGRSMLWATVAIETLAVLLLLFGRPVGLRRAGWALLVVALLGAAVLVHRVVLPDRRAIVLAPEVTLRDPSDMTTPGTVRVRAGVVVTVIERRSQYAHIASEGESGWVDEKDLGLVE